MKKSHYNYVNICLLCPINILIQRKIFQLILYVEQAENKDIIQWIHTCMSKKNTFQKSRVYSKSNNQICLIFYSICNFCFLQSQKGCNVMYQTLFKSNLKHFTSISKCSIYGINVSKTYWKKYFTLPFRRTKETKLH